MATPEEIRKALEAARAGEEETGEGFRILLEQSDRDEAHSLPLVGPFTTSTLPIGLRSSSLPEGGLPDFEKEDKGFFDFLPGHARSRKFFQERGLTFGQMADTTLGALGQGFVEMGQAVRNPSRLLPDFSTIGSREGVSFPNFALETRQQIEGFETEQGRQPNLSERVELAKEGTPLPTGVRGALETFPLLAAPSAIGARATLAARGGRAANAGAALLEPLATMEAATGAAIGGLTKKAGQTFDRLLRTALPGEQPTQAILRRYEGAVGAAANEASIIVTEGSTRLKAVGIGRSARGRLVPLEEDVPAMDDLFSALHNPTGVASGDVIVSPRFRKDYEELRKLTDWEEAARVDFDPTMATVEDYFYRGWKVPEGFAAQPGVGGQIGARPAFRRPRVDASYQEMRDAGFEPMFWNPYEQWRAARMQGVINREQTKVVEDLKQYGLAVPNSGEVAMQGWRTPDVGPAFRGKPFAVSAADGTSGVGFTSRWAVPDEIAARLENIYGKRPNLDKLHVGSREVDVMKAIDAATFIPKRFKLFGSLFQQRDFLQRSFAGSWAKMVDDLSAGRPVEAVKSLAVWPRSAYRIIEGNVGPGARLRIKQDLNSTAPLLEGRPDVHMRGVMEGGLSTIDPTIFAGNIDDAVRTLSKDKGLLGIKWVRDQFLAMESAMRRGLFEGTYPAAQLADIRNNIAPMLAREFPSLSDEALNGMIAQTANLRYSTLSASQSLLQARWLRETLRRTIFSIGENEALLRQATQSFRGPNQNFWRKNWLGAYLSVLATANAIHYASTGQPLPKERYVPVSRDDFGPLPFGFQVDFASPDLPIVDRTGRRLLLDVVGQLDTALRVLDPRSFIEARESVPVRAAWNQITGKDFYNQPIDEVGPGGIFSRLRQLVSDAFAPIGIGESAFQIARQNIPGAEELIPVGEARIGTGGHLLQATGLNVRALSTSKLLDAAAGEAFEGRAFAQLNAKERNQLTAMPDIQAELSRRQEEAILRGSEYQQYQQDKDDTNSKYDTLINRSAQALELGRELRNRIGGLQNERRVELDSLRTQNEDILREPKEPTLPFDRALADYYGILYEADPPLEDPDTGRYDFRRRDALLEAWRDKHSKLADEVQEFVHQDEPEIVTELRQAREMLRDYWSIDDRIIGSRGIRSVYDRYRDEHTADKRRFRELHPELDEALGDADFERMVLRTPEIERLLLRWGYISSPQTPEVDEENFERQLEKELAGGFRP